MAFRVSLARRDSDDWQRLNGLILLISALVAASTALVVAASLVVQEVRTRNRNAADLNAAAEIVSRHVYNYDIQAVRSVGATLMHRDFVKQIEIVGAQDNLLYRSTGSFNDHGVYQSDYPLTARQDASQQPMVIGVLRVWRLDTAWQTIFSYALLAALLTFTLVFVPSYLAVKSYIRLFVVKPLQQLSHAIDKTLESGHPAKTNFNDATHLGRFASQFDKMQEKLVEVQSKLSFHTAVAREQAEVLAQILVAGDRAVLYFKSDGTMRRYNLSPASEKLLAGLGSASPSRNAQTMRDAVLAAAPGQCEVSVLNRAPQRNAGTSAKTLYELEIRGPGEQIREVALVDLGNDDLALIVSDVTHLRHMENETIQARKIESLGALTGGVAHDINNVLAVIIGNLQIIESRHAGDAELMARVRSAMHAGDRGAGIVRALLNFSRQDVERGVVMNATQAVLELAPMLESSLDASIKFSIRTEGDLYIQATRAEFTTAILNLVINARDAMPAGGRLGVRIYRISDGTEGAESQTSSVAITVSDTGCGIPPNLLDKIGDPFFATKPVGKGNGMGLALVHAFAKRSSGRLNYWNNPDVGATFCLTFPESAAAAPEVSALDSIHPDAAEPHGRVLVVDDEAELATAIKELIETPTIIVETIGLVEEAKRRLLRPPHIDIVLTDLSMPDGTGLDLLRAIRSCKLDMPVILMSGNVDSSRISEWASTEVAEIVDKPLDFQRLSESIARLLTEAEKRSSQAMPQKQSAKSA